MDDIKDENGIKLYNVCRLNYIKDVKLLLKNEDIVKLLLEDERIDVNIQNDEYRTALHESCEYDIDIAKQILKYKN